MEPCTELAKKKSSIILGSTKPEIAVLKALRKRMSTRLSKKFLRKNSMLTTALNTSSKLFKNANNNVVIASTTKSKRAIAKWL
jgi:hypothetical protein